MATATKKEASPHSSEWLYNSGSVQVDETTRGNVVAYYHNRGWMSTHARRSLMHLADNINRPVVVIDWANKHALKYLDKERTSGKPFFIFLPNPSIKPQKEYPTDPLVFKNIGAQSNCYLHNQTDYVNNIKKRFPSEQKAKDIVTKNGKNVGSYNDRYLKLFYGGFFNNEPHTANFVKEILELIEEDLFKDIKIEQEANRYRQYIHHTHNELREGVRKEIKQSQEQIASSYRNINRYERTMLEKNVALQSMEKRAEAFNNTFLKSAALGKMIKSLLKDKFKRFEYLEDRIIGYTKMVHIHSQESRKKFQVGEFEITIMLSGTVKFNNLTKCFREFEHPHICDHYACFGNIKDAVPKLLFQGDFLGLFSLLHNFLSSYQYDGSYIPIELGWGEKGDFCGPCDKPSRLCGCNTCNHCDEALDDCECDRCSHCNAVEDDCECSRCGACNETLEDCECDRCKDCDELVDEGDCECERCDECSGLIEGQHKDCECKRCSGCEELEDNCKCD